VKFSAPLMAANLEVQRRAERGAKGRLDSRTALEAAFVALRQAASLEGWRIQAPRGRRVMAREVTTVIKSDLSGEMIPEDQAVTMTLTFADGRRNRVELDLSESEAKQFVAKGREIKRRGRPRGSRNKTKTEG
jgi:hypothetical protein